MSVAAIGLLNLNKPVGITSRRVVDVVQRLDREARRWGTRGRSTRWCRVCRCFAWSGHVSIDISHGAQMLSSLILAGPSDADGSVEGEVTVLADPPRPSRGGADVDTAARRRAGEIRQRPPAYSALKIKGRRAYDLARKGRRWSWRPARWLSTESTCSGDHYPELEIEVECGSGTVYIRSLGRDLAKSVGHDGGRRRRANPDRRIPDRRCRDPESLTKENWTEHLQPSRLAMRELPQATLDPQQTRRVSPAKASAARTLPSDTVEIAALDESGDLIGSLGAGKRAFGPTRVLARASKI